MLSIVAIAAAAISAVYTSGMPFINRTLTIMSLKKLDKYPLYSMTYYGDYNLNYETANPKLQPQCTSFLAFNEKGEPMLCRNLDNALYFHPMTMLTTRAPGKCATMAMCDIYYMGYDLKHLPAGSIFTDQALLESPRIPIDGMNEYGLALSILNVPHAEPPAEPGKKSVDQTAMIRLALDHAKNVDEAVDLIKSYNVVMAEGGIHYQIADASGDSAIVEFAGGEVVVIKKADRWQAVTNFIISGTEHEGIGQERYKAAQDKLSAVNGVLSEDEAMALLKKVAQGGTNWSVIYNLKTGEARIAMDQHYDNILKFKLQMRR